MTAIGMDGDRSGVRPEAGFPRRAAVFLASAFTVAVIGATSLATPVATNAAPTPRADRVALTVGTFNVNNGAAGLGTGADRLDRIASEIRRSGFDVVGLQESKTSMRDALTPRLHPEYTYSLLGDSKGRNATGGQIFYRTDVLHPGQLQGMIPLPTTFGSPRFGLYQDFYHRATGAHFLFASVHLSNLDGRAASDARERQAQHLMARLAAINSEGLPLVVVGDMNSNHAKKYVYDAPRISFQQSGLGEVFDRTTTKVNASLNSFNHLQRTPKRGGYRPDQIYVSSNIGVEYVETMARLVTRKVTVKKNGKRLVKKIQHYRMPFISDHNAIRAITVIPGH